MLREVIVVEGKSDVAAVRRAVDADCLVTGGFSLSPQLLAQIEAASRRRGIVILTDPDSAGERIRSFLRQRFPEAGHAFIPRSAAVGSDGRIGVEKASPDQIRQALSKVRIADLVDTGFFNQQDLLDQGLNGGARSSEKRAFLGEELGLGWANAKTFLHRLNRYGVNREEFDAALRRWEELHD